MDDSLDFTDDEIREELSKLGYSSVPDTKLEEFKKGLYLYLSCRIRKPCCSSCTADQCLKLFFFVVTCSTIFFF